MPKARDNRLRTFPDRRAAAEAARECRTARFPKVVPDTVAGGLNVVRRDTCRGRSVSGTSVSGTSVSSTWLCEDPRAGDGRFRFLDTCDW